MSEVSKLLDIVNSFDFKKGDYLGAEEQLSMFAENYALLNAEDVELLRGKFCAKDRLGWLRVASTLLVKGFNDADSLRKEKLCRIFLALYSFENLEFGFDGVKDVIAVSDYMKSHAGMVKRNWDQFSKLTSSDTARNNLENKIFATKG
jgi:hypothetical protein